MDSRVKAKRFEWPKWAGALGVAAMALGLLVGLAAAGPPAGDGLGRAIAAQEAHTPNLLAIDGVVGTAVGLNAGGQPSVLVLTESPGVAGIPRELDGVAVVAKVIGRIVALDPPPHDHPTGGDGDDGGAGETTDCDPRTGKSRPACIGISTGHPAITACTIGARVKDIHNNVFALSNNHCYARTNLANIGDPVIQPGTFDDGLSPADDIGTLSAFVPIDFEGGNNTIDAAIAALSSSLVLGNATPSDGYGTPKSATVTASLNLKVMKYGRTTGETKGRVTAINATVMVNYGAAGVAKFVNQIIIEPGDFSAGGDSGSLIVVDGKGKNKADDRKPVGLLFAGSFFVTIASPIDAVLTAFGVTIDGE